MNVIVLEIQDWVGLKEPDISGYTLPSGTSVTPVEVPHYYYHPYYQVGHFYRDIRLLYWISGHIGYRPILTGSFFPSRANKDFAFL